MDISPRFRLILKVTKRTKDINITDPAPKPNQSIAHKYPDYLLPHVKLTRHKLGQVYFHIKQS